MKTCLLIFLLNSVIVARPMTEEDCAKWKPLMKPEQLATCVVITQTPMGPYVERKL